PQQVGDHRVDPGGGVLVEVTSTIFADGSPLSSSAKADDPVNAGVGYRSDAGDYWMPAFAGITVDMELTWQPTLHEHGQIPDRRELARERVGRIPGIAQRLEPRRACVEHDQPPDEALAKATDLADHLERHHGAEYACHGTQDARLGAGRHRARGRRLRKQTTI